MSARIVTLIGLSLAVGGGALVVSERISVAQTPAASETAAVTSPPAAAAPPPAPVVTVSAPLPPERPAIAVNKESLPAKLLFAAKKLPSIGKAMAIGYYPRGCLAGGVELPVNGPTWQVMRLSRNRNWGHPELVRFLERFAPLAAKATGWHGILVGDMAQPRGGPLPFGHLSHQIGLDVDVWFMPMPGHRLSKQEREKIPATNLVAADWKHVNPKTWTPADAAFIRTAAEQPEVERVLVNAAIKKELCHMEGKHHYAWMAKVRPWYGHNDHIHVRLKCPAGSPHCRHQPPVPGGDGCDKSLDYWFSDRVLHPHIKKGGKPRKQIMLADLPLACKTVLNAPAKGSVVTNSR
jgi:penicillin-insensitive murein endopeptidase